MRIIPISKQFELVVSDNKVTASSVRKADGTEWSDKDNDNDTFDTVIASQYAKMYDLLLDIYESTGPGACEQQLPDAVTAVSEFMNNLREGS